MPKKSINSAKSFGIHVDAAASLTDIEKKIFLCMQGLCGASDYGSFSAHTPSLFSDKYVTARLIFPVESAGQYKSAY